MCSSDLSFRVLDFGKPQGGINRRPNARNNLSTRMAHNFCSMKSFFETKKCVGQPSLSAFQRIFSFEKRPHGAKVMNPSCRRVWGGGGVSILLQTSSKRESIEFRQPYCFCVLLSDTNAKWVEDTVWFVSLLCTLWSQHAASRMTAPSWEFVFQVRGSVHWSVVYRACPHVTVCKGVWFLGCDTSTQIWAQPNPSGHFFWIL